MTASAAKTGSPVADLTVGPPPAPQVRPKDPGAADVVPDDLAQLEESVPQVDESMVRMSLQALGGLISYPLGDDDVPGHWRFSDQELHDLVPPLTRIVNRNVKLRRAVIRGDELAVAVAFGGYLGRNITDGNKARKVRDEREGQAEAAEGDARANGSGVVEGGFGGWPHAGDGAFDDGSAGGGLDR